MTHTLAVVTVALLLSAGAAQADPAVERIDGVTRLLIDGNPTLPIVFFHNTDIPGEKSDRYLREQVTLARGLGGCICTRCR